MEELMEQCEESVFPGIQNGDNVTMIDIVESRKDFKITSPIGTAIPLQARAVGKLFLSLMDAKDLRKYLHENPLVRYTTNTIIVSRWHFNLINQGSCLSTFTLLVLFKKRFN
jgi:IclR family transcriptional regulator, KDG regulon repressor